jgi:pimeloyl-ACP methyl ester carboxylesterase
MISHTNQTAPTQFVEANSIRFGYRRFGNPRGVPILFNQHFRGTLDYWDPAVTDGLAQTREVILFDNAGIASSSGEVPASIPQMGANAIAFIRALGLSRVDVLGFSIGGMVAQEIARHCQLSGPKAPFSGPARLERGSIIGVQRSSPTRAAAPPTRIPRLLKLTMPPGQGQGESLPLREPNQSTTKGSELTGIDQVLELELDGEDVIIILYDLPAGEP